MSKFLNKVLLEKDFQESFKQNSNTPEISDFIGHVLIDLNKFLESVFDNFYKIKEELTNIAKNQSSPILNTYIIK